MKTRLHAHTKGFTLVEMLLVLVIVSFIIVLSIGYLQQKTLEMRVDRASAQMQQILNAGLAYYVANGSWPTQLSNLQGTYLPPATVPLQSPWGQGYAIVPSTTPPAQLFVYTAITGTTASAAAAIIAGRLPMSYTTATAGNPPPAGGNCTTAMTTCYVVASVNIPGQNLNNATAVNFAGLYHHGGCVPVPACPVDANGNTMTPEIVIVPVSVSGVNDPNSNTVYPISSFTAYAVGPSATPGACTSGSIPAPAPCGDSTPSSTGQYWRACLQVVTQKGDVAITNVGGVASAVPPYYPWGGNVTLLGMTRCKINNEPSGSTFSVFAQ